MERPEKLTIQREREVIGKKETHKHTDRKSDKQINTPKEGQKVKAKM